MNMIKRILPVAFAIVLFVIHTPGARASTDTDKALRPILGQVCTGFLGQYDDHGSVRIFGGFRPLLKDGKIVLEYRGVLARSLVDENKEPTWKQVPLVGVLSPKINPGDGSVMVTSPSALAPRYYFFIKQGADGPYMYGMQRTKTGHFGFTWPCRTVAEN